MPTGVYKRTEETKRKMSLAHKGIKNPNALKNLGIFSQKGTKRNVKTRKKMSEAHKGEKNHSWKDGRTLNLKKYREKINREWVNKNRDRKNFHTRKRRCFKKQVEGSYTFGEWELLKKQYGYTCPCCGKSEPEIQLTEDHIIPLSRGGSNYLENIQPLCRSCNAKKHTKIIKYDFITKT